MFVYENIVWSIWLTNKAPKYTENTTTRPTWWHVKTAIFQARIWNQSPNVHPPSVPVSRRSLGTSKGSSLGHATLRDTERSTGPYLLLLIWCSYLLNQQSASSEKKLIRITGDVSLLASFLVESESTKARVIWRLQIVVTNASHN